MTVILLLDISAYHTSFNTSMILGFPFQTILLSNYLIKSTLSTKYVCQELHALLKTKRIKTTAFYVRRVFQIVIVNLNVSNSNASNENVTVAASQLFKSLPILSLQNPSYTRITIHGIVLNAFSIRWAKFDQIPKRSLC